VPDIDPLNVPSNEDVPKVANRLPALFTLPLIVKLLLATVDLPDPLTVPLSLTVTVQVPLSLPVKVPDQLPLNGLLSDFLQELMAKTSMAKNKIFFIWVLFGLFLLIWLFGIAPFLLVAGLQFYVTYTKLAKWFVGY